MAERGRYKTRQRALVEQCLRENGDRYLTVDSVVSRLSAADESVGRTTVYRALEFMCAEGTALKATSPKGESSYRMTPEALSGQLVCLECGQVLPLDCGMLDEFSTHVKSHHGFAIDPARTVLYGLCEACAKSGESDDR